MTWWLKAAEELRTLRQLGIATPGSVISGFILDAPTVTIEGEATEVAALIADQPATSPALSLPAPLQPEAPALPVVQSPPPAEAPRKSFLRGEGRYKLRWEIRPQLRKTASR
jgi:hypothetical protein